MFFGSFDFSLIPFSFFGLLRSGTQLTTIINLILLYNLTKRSKHTDTHTPRIQNGEKEVKTEERKKNCAREKYPLPRSFPIFIFPKQNNINFPAWRLGYEICVIQSFIFGFFSMNKYILSDVEYVEPVINYLCWNLLKYTNNNNIIKISLLHEFQFMFRNIIYDTQTKSYYYITHIHIYIPYHTKHTTSRAYNCIEVLTNANKFHFFVLS